MASPRIRKSFLAASLLLCMGLLAVVYLLVEPVSELIFLHSVYRGKTLPRIEQHFEYAVDYFGFRYRGHTENWVDRNLLFFGAYEKPVLFFIQDAVQRWKIDDPVILDVGAYTGTHSLFMCRFAGAVHAFEPSATSRQRLLNAVAENGIANIHVHSEALGNQNGTLPFYDSGAGGSVVASFVKGFRADQAAPVMASIVRGDDKLRELEVTRVHLIKMDIEGFEKYALEGLRETLEQSRPVVVMELNMIGEPGFHSEKELRDVFPQRYEFLVFQGGIYTRSGNYKLVDYPFAFDARTQPELVVYPSELKSIIPRSNQ